MSLSRSEVRRALFMLVLVWILATGPRELAELGAALSVPRPARAARRATRAPAAGVMRARRR
jgi:hypothetical protein